MLAGHIGVALAVRARWPRAALPALLVATMVPDLADLALPQGDQCRTSCELYTHAFPAVLVLATVAAAFAWTIWHRRVVVIATFALVVVHVLSDLLTGVKPYWPGGPSLGLNLYRFHITDFVVEGALLIGGWLLLRREPTAPRWITRVWPVLLVLVAQGAFDVFLHDTAAERRPAVIAPRRG